MITIWQVASIPFWAAAAFLFIRSIAPVFEKPSKDANQKILNRLIGAGIFAYIAARICT